MRLLNGRDVDSFDQMPRPKIEAVYKELPWLEDFFEQWRVKAFYVMRLTQEMLAHTSDSFVVKGISTPYEIIYILDKNGKIINFSRPETVPGRNYLFFRGKPRTTRIFYRGVVHPGRSISETMGSLSQELAQVEYVVSYHYNRGILQIVKKPRNTSVQDWFEKPILSDEHKKLRKELAKINR